MLQLAVCSSVPRGVSELEMGLPFWECCRVDSRYFVWYIPRSHLCFPLIKLFYKVFHSGNLVVLFLYSPHNHGSRITLKSHRMLETNVLPSNCSPHLLGWCFYICLIFFLTVYFWSILYLEKMGDRIILLALLLAYQEIVSNWSPTQSLQWEEVVSSIFLPVDLNEKKHIETNFLLAKLQWVLIFFIC